jgi:TonB family protein
MSSPDRFSPISGESKPSQAAPLAGSEEVASTEPPPELSESNAEVVLSSLRTAIAARSQEPASLLKAVAAVAQALTAADGTALALRRDQSVVCCARSGGAAPELGTVLSEDSGISGECLRNGEALRCDDTYTDPRVDPVVCRVLGLRSIAIVPVREQGRVAGILEAFSTRSYAFNERHTGFLAELALLAEAAQIPERPAAQAAELSPIEEPVSEEMPELTFPTMESMWTAESSAPESAPDPGKRQRVVRLVVVGALTLVLLSLIGWWTLREQRSPAAQKAAVSQPESASTAPPATPLAPAPEATVPKAEVEKAAEKENISAPARPARREQSKTPPDSQDVVVTQIDHSPARTIRGLPPAVSKGPAPAPATAAAEPQIVFVPSETSTLGGLLTPSLPAPKLSPPVSSGVSPAILEHRVAPVYPRNALTARLSGTVVLQITIGVNGNVRGLKVLQGNPVLARAAMDAVRQWRYRPSTLNGKLTEAQTEVTVNFELP